MYGLLNNNNNNNNEPRSRLDNIRQLTKFGVAFGHGGITRPGFTVPPDVHVVFLAKPGFPFQLIRTDVHFKDMLKNVTKLGKFIKGTLPTNEIPMAVTYDGWDWTKHVYGPGMYVPSDVKLSLYDTTSEYRNSFCGLWVLNKMYPGTFKYIFKPEQMFDTTASDCARYLSSTYPGCVLFVAACRVEQGGRPNTRLIRKTAQAEEQAARLIARKRRAPTGTTPERKNKSTVNQGPGAARRRRLEKHLKMITHIRRNTFGQRTFQAVKKPVLAARKYYPNFFPANMSNENVRKLINNIKRSPNLHLRIRNMNEPVTPEWKNSANVAKRILWRIEHVV